MTFGQGSATVVYRPLAFDGTFSASHVRLGLSFGPDGSISDRGGTAIEPIPDACIDPDPKKRPDTCPKPRPVDQFDGLPEVEVFDRTGAGTWHRLPHLNQGTTYDLVGAAKYVDPKTGAVLVRFVNERQDPVSVFLGLSIQGTVR
jgi:hypothetical protein